MTNVAEFLIVKCQPFYLLRESTIVITVAVYITPSANTEATANESFEGVHDAMNELQTKHPERNPYAV